MTNESKLKAIRLRRGLTQTDVSEKTNLNIGTYRAYEQKNKNLDNAKLETLLKISNVLECNLSDIVESERLSDMLRQKHV